MAAGKILVVDDERKIVGLELGADDYVSGQTIVVDAGLTVTNTG